MATLLDTSALVVLIRRRRSAVHEPVARAARDEIEGGRALVSAVTAVELLVGARGESGARRLVAMLDSLPVVAADRDMAVHAGRLGAQARADGVMVPVPDLLIAATAVLLDIPLLTCDSDFVRASAAAARGRLAADVEDGGGHLWSSLRLHPASAV